MNYKYLFIDNDNTLMDFYKSEYISIGKALQICGLPSDDETRAAYSRLNDACWKDYEKGLLTRREIPLRRFSELIEWLGLPENDELVQKLVKTYERELSSSAIYFEGAEEFLREIKGKIHICIVTNGSDIIQTSRLAISGLDKLADSYVISERFGVQKPDKAFFDVAFEVSGCTDPKDAVVVGDSLTSDIAGGKAAGIDTCLFDLKGKYASSMGADYYASSFEALKEII